MRLGNRSWLGVYKRRRVVTYMASCYLGPGSGMCRCPRYPRGLHGYWGGVFLSLTSCLTWAQCTRPVISLQFPDTSEAELRRGVLVLTFLPSQDLHRLCPLYALICHSLPHPGRCALCPDLCPARWAPPHLPQAWGTDNEQQDLPNKVCVSSTLTLPLLLSANSVQLARLPGFLTAKDRTPGSAIAELGPARPPFRKPFLISRQRPLPSKHPHLLIYHLLTDWFIYPLFTGNIASNKK